MPLPVTPRMGCILASYHPGASLPTFQGSATEHQCTSAMGQHGAEVTNHQSRVWHLRHAYGPPDPCMRIGSGIFTRRVHSYDTTYFCVGTRAAFNHWLCTTGKPPSALWGEPWRSQLWCATFGLPQPRVHECEKLSSRQSQTQHLNEKRRPQVSDR